MANLFLSSIAKNAVGFFFPRLCVVCTERLSNDKWLCDACLQTLADNHAGRDACGRCGQNRTIRQCTCEYNWPNPFESIFSIFDFDETVKAVAHEFKYGGMKRLAFDMGKSYSPLVPASFFEGMDAIVAVPLFFLRRMRRGYNQAEYFARGVAQVRGGTPLFLPDILVRKRPTKTQTKLSRQKRRTNVQGAFVVPKRKRGAVAGKNIIIVDDIVTTAATTRECCLALKSAGCGNVKVLSLARD
jgi:competence protein ComFC